MNVLDILLKMDNGKLQPPTQEVKIKRLSKAAGEDVVFTIKALSLDRLEEIRESNSMTDFPVMVVVEGVVNPSMKAPELKEKLGTKTPAETVRKLFLAGEIEDLCTKITRLSGYGQDAVEEIKKK